MQSVNCEPRQWSICAVPSCPNTAKDLSDTSELKFHRFPHDTNLINVWKEKCNIPNDFDVSKACICSHHFTPDAYATNCNDEFNRNSFVLLKSDAVPTDNLIGDICKVELKVYTNNTTTTTTDSQQFATKKAANDNLILTQQLHKLLKDQNKLKMKLGNCEMKTANKCAKIDKLKRRIENMMMDKSKTGKFDDDLIHKVFSQAQIDILMGKKKKVVWSYDDLAMGFTLRHIGNKECYLYLKNTLNMPLPSLSCVQKWVASNKLV